MTAAESSTKGPAPLLDLERLVAGIRRQRRLWLSFALVGLLSGALLSVLVPDPPTGLARVLIVRADDQAVDRDVLMATDLAVFRTAEVADAALRKLGSNESTTDFLSSYSGAPASPNVLEITASGRSDADALARAQALADAFIDSQVRRARDADEAQVTALNEQRAALQRTLAELPTVTEPNAPAERAAARRDELVAQLAALDRVAAETRPSAPIVIAGTRLVDAPRILPASLLQTSATNALVGLVIGLGVGLAIAAILCVTRDRPVLRRDIAANLGASVIGQLPAPPGRLRRRLPRLRRGARHDRERERVAASLARLLLDPGRSGSLLELGCPDSAATLARDIADRLASEHPVVIVDGLGRDALDKGTTDGDEGTTKDEGTPDGDEGTTGGDEATTEDTTTEDEGTTQDEGTPDGDEATTEDTTTEDEGTTEDDGRIKIVDIAELPLGAAAANGTRDIYLGVGSVGPGTAWDDLARLGAETLLVVRAGHASTEWLHIVARQLEARQIAVLGVVLVQPDPRDRTDGTLWDALHTARRERGQTTAIAVASGAEPEPAPRGLSSFDSLAAADEVGVP